MLFRSNKSSNFLPLLITVACNPYCGPCANSHKKLDDLLKRYANKFKVQIRFLCRPENEKDALTIAVKSILQMAENNVDLQLMLTDWFEWMDIEKWKTKWQPDNNIDVTERLQQHGKWITNNNVAHTPTFFINGKKLPGRYNLDDLEILTPQLTEMMNKEKNVNN